MVFIATSTEGVKLDPQYWAGTAGAIAASQLTFVTALGMKNNVISRPCVSVQFLELDLILPI
jgi:hypothetical protein